MKLRRGLRSEYNLFLPTKAANAVCKNNGTLALAHIRLPHTSELIVLRSHYLVQIMSGVPFTAVQSPTQAVAI